MATHPYLKFIQRNLYIYKKNGCRRTKQYEKTTNEKHLEKYIFCFKVWVITNNVVTDPFVYHCMRLTIISDYHKHMTLIRRDSGFINTEKS